MASHKPPSRIRYEKTHPVVSFRVKIDYYKRLKSLLKDTDRSIGDFFREALGVQETNYAKMERKAELKGFRRGKKEGYKKGKEDWNIWFYCNVCGEVIWIRPSDNAHEHIIKYMKEVGWGHAKCHDKRSSGNR